MCGGWGASNPPTICPLLMSSSQFHADVFRFREEVQRLETTFTTHAAFTHPAKRHAKIAQEPAIDPHRSRVNRRGDAMCALQIACPKCCGEPVARRIGKRYGFFFRIEGCDGHDRPEYLLLQYSAVTTEAGNDCRLHEPAGAVEAVSARLDRAAFLTGEINIARHLAEMSFADQRAHVGFLV